MAQARRIPSEFAPVSLIRRIVQGALHGDPVRLHGAIVAAFEIHGLDIAQRDVFPAARRLAAKFGTDCDARVSAAIDVHIQDRQTVARAATATS